MARRYFRVVDRLGGVVFENVDETRLRAWQRELDQLTRTEPALERDGYRIAELVDGRPGPASVWRPSPLIPVFEHQSRAQLESQEITAGVLDEVF